MRDQVVTPFATTAARDSAITSPLAGMLAAITSNDGNEGLSMRNSASQWRPPWNLPWGLAAAVAGKTALQTNIGTGDTDVTGLSVSWTAVTNRSYQIIGYCYVVTGTSASFPLLKIKDAGGNVRAIAYPSGSATPAGAVTIGGFIHLPGIGATAGATSAKITVNFTVNTNNQAGGQSIFDAAQLSVADVGPGGGAPA